jgi:hypothetical protein
LAGTSFEEGWLEGAWLEGLWLEGAWVEFCGVCSAMAVTIEDNETAPTTVSAKIFRI